LSAEHLADPHLLNLSKHAAYDSVRQGTQLDCLSSRLQNDRDIHVIAARTAALADAAAALPGHPDRSSEPQLLLEAGNAGPALRDFMARAVRLGVLVQGQHVLLIEAGNIGPAWRSNRDFMGRAISHSIEWLRGAGDWQLPTGSHIQGLNSDKELVLSSIREKDGNALGCASDSMRSNKQVVIAAVSKTPAALKFALEHLNQDPDCLKAAGLWSGSEQARHTGMRSEKCLYPIKFSLAATSSTYATVVTLALKNHIDLGTFEMYFPSAFMKESCDADFTNTSHPCRGQVNGPGACQLRHYPTNLLGLARDGNPTSASCWRFSWRHHAQKCKDSGGFVAQVEECFPSEDGKGVVHLLGNGQQIETDISLKMKLKLFRVRQGVLIAKNGLERPRPFDTQDADAVSKEIMKWFAEGARNPAVKGTTKHNKMLLIRLRHEQE